MRTILLFLAISLTVAACGIKGDPQPPKSTETQQAQ
jgi:predicted small lipoprotein YifL